MTSFWRDEFSVSHTSAQNLSPPFFSCVQAAVSLDMSLPAKRLETPLDGILQEESAANTHSGLPSSSLQNQNPADARKASLAPPSLLESELSVRQLPKANAVQASGKLDEIKIERDLDALLDDGEPQDKMPSVPPAAATATPLSAEKTEHQTEAPSRPKLSSQEAQFYKSFAKVEANLGVRRSSITGTISKSKPADAREAPLENATPGIELGEVGLENATPDVKLGEAPLENATPGVELGEVDLENATPDVELGEASAVENTTPASTGSNEVLAIRFRLSVVILMYGVTMPTTCCLRPT